MRLHNGTPVTFNAYLIAIGRPDLRSDHAQATLAMRIFELRHRDIDPCPMMQAYFDWKLLPAAVEADEE